MFKKYLEVVIFNKKDPGKIIGRYKTSVVPVVGDHYAADAIFSSSPNYMVQRRILPTEDFNKDRIIVYVIEVLELHKQKDEIIKFLTPFL